MPSYMRIVLPSNPVVLKLAEAARRDDVTVDFVRVRGKRTTSIRKILLNGHLCHIQHLSNLFSRGDRNAIYARSTLLWDTIEAFAFHIFAVELKYDTWFFIVPKDDLKGAFLNTDLKFIDSYIRVDAGSKSSRTTNFDFGQYFNAWEVLKDSYTAKVAQLSSGDAIATP